jgi:predicted nucleic acid-binding protein
LILALLAPVRKVLRPDVPELLRPDAQSPRELLADLLLSTQVLQEFYWAVTREPASPLPEEVAEERVRDFSRLPLVRVDIPMILAAIARSRSFSFWDSLVVEAALRAGTAGACSPRTCSTDSGSGT